MSYLQLQQQQLGSSFQPVTYMNLVNSFQGMNTQPLGAINVQQSQTAFAQLSGSKESLFASNLLPIPPKFAFQERTGRINWRALMNTDLEKVSREVDLKSLETLLQNITFASLERDDLERLGDAHFIKLFRLSQYSIEYLLYSQNYMESLCKTLDAEYKLTYEKTVKTEEVARKYQQELKLMRKELKLKQKTLSTYEYLMKLPLEQEQEVNKCRHCPREKPKFFLNRDYLAKHYQRNHPEVDFHREFSDGAYPVADYNNTLNERTLQTTLEKQQQQAKIDQEQLFDKIKKDLFVSLSDNFKSIEKELAEVKQKADYKQIQGLLQNIESKNEEEQRRIQESLNKPAKMLEDLKSKWADMFYQQGANIKEAISTTVNEALAKRKEERDKKKLDRTKNSDNSQDNVSQIQEQKIKFFEQRINEFDSKFQENERLKRELEEKLRYQQKLLEEKELQEQILQERLAQEIEQRQLEEKERLLTEQRLNQKLRDQEQYQLLSMQEADQKRMKEAQEQEEQRIKEEQEKIKRQELAQQQEQQRIAKEQQDKIDQEKEREALQKLKDEKEALLLKQKQEKEEADRKLREEQENKNKQQLESDEEIIEEEEEEEDDAEEQQKIIDAQRKAEAEKILNEDIVPQNQPQKVDPKISKKQVITKTLSKEIQKGSNMFEGDRAHIRSLFNHPQPQVKSQRQDILVESMESQTQFLEQEFEDLKIKSVLPEANPLSKTRKDDLRNVADELKGINAKDTDRIKNSIDKRLHDQDFAPFSAMIDEFLKRSLN